MENSSTYLDEVRVLSDHSEHEDASKVSELEKLIDDAKQMGCVEALQKHGHNTSYLLDEGRASYIELLNLKEGDAVLEIGSSMGQHTRLMAKRCGQISALEVVPLQGAFSKIWCDEEGLENVDVTAGGVSGKLPYADGSFDVIVCNYVLEWCAGRQQGSEENFHREFIKEMLRCLRANGKLYLSTKNRYSIRYLLGSVDEHLGIRFGSALPRLIQRFVRWRANLGHPTGYLHSWSALQRLLKDVGFQKAEKILTFPDARYPKYIRNFSDFNKKEVPINIREEIGIKNRMALSLPSSLFAKTTNSLVFLAYK